MTRLWKSQRTEQKLLELTSKYGRVTRYNKVIFFFQYASMKNCNVKLEEKQYFNSTTKGEYLGINPTKYV